MYDEYLRRNLLVAKAIGARENARATLARLNGCAYAPKWLWERLQGIIDRCEPLPADLALWRNTAPDAPEHAKLQEQQPEKP